MAHPVFVFAPYLTVSEPVVVGPWWAGPARDFEGPWASSRFRELSLALLGAFRDPRDQPLQHPTLIARAASGVDGEPLGHGDIVALQRAIHFASLDRNPAWSTVDGNEGLRTSTADNSEIFVWPIDLEDARITLSSGAMVRVLDGGHRIDEELRLTAPSELWLPGPTRLHEDVANAVYATLTEDALGDRALATRIGVAIDWLAHAWRNSPSITFDQRIVMLKVAFDTLTGTDKTHVAAEWLEALFRRLHDEGATDDECEDILWKPGEAPRHTRTWGNGESEICTDLVHWFHTLGTTRNAIVHDGTAQSLTYEEELSAYTGPLHHVAERFLRETIRVCLRDYGFTDLWRSGTFRTLKRSFERAEQETQRMTEQ